jgi:hypothetical protein
MAKLIAKFTSLYFDSDDDEGDASSGVGTAQPAVEPTAVVDGPVIDPAASNRAWCVY